MTSKRIVEIAVGIVLLVFGAVMSLYLYMPVVTADTTAYCHRTVILESALEIVKVSRHPDDIVFRFSTYPGVCFGVASTHLLHAITGLKAGDTANVMLLNEEYARAIEHKGNVLAQLVSGRPNLYGFTRNGKNYIDFGAILAAEVSPTIVIPVVLTFAFLFVYAGIRALFFSKLSGRGRHRGNL